MKNPEAEAAAGYYLGAAVSLSIGLYSAAYAWDNHHEYQTNVKPKIDEIASAYPLPSQNEIADSEAVVEEFRRYFKRPNNPAFITCRALRFDEPSELGKACNVLITARNQQNELNERLDRGGLSERGDRLNRNALALFLNAIGSSLISGYGSLKGISLVLSSRKAQMNKN